jgi:anti-sigma B factor antagonist
MAELTVIRTDRGTKPWLVVALVGEIDTSTTPVLRARLTNLIEAGHHHLVLDMAAVAFWDSAGMAVVVHIWKQLRARTGMLIVAGLGEVTVRAWHITGLNRLIPSYATVAEALQAHSGADGPLKTQGAVPAMGLPAAATD